MTLLRNFLDDIPDRIRVWREIASRNEGAHYQTVPVPISEFREMLDVIERAAAKDAEDAA